MKKSIGTNEYDFHLTTLLIVDEYGAGVPGAFCISSRKDATTWAVFFRKLKEHIGTMRPTVHV